ncbi:hypothetical protein AMJ85_03175 [candidate division BRC1 bacterium SM23_51]|nr:MAG: hypothetical protein AMJ85_03175 [candidate division BRC1 bacterium SM23_51]
MRNISKIFLAGLAAILPILVTLYILYWLGFSAEYALGGLIRKVLPEGFYRFGMGILAGVVVIFLTGLALRAWIVRKIFDLGSYLFERIPFVKTVYGAVQDLISFFSPSKDKALGQVVMVTLGDTKLRLMGFVTRQDFSAVPDGVGDQNTIAVYLPMSYQIGGFTAMLPRSAVERVDMTVQDAVRFAMTAGMSSPQVEGKETEQIDRRNERSKGTDL